MTFPIAAIAPALQAAGSGIKGAAAGAGGGLGGLGAAASGGALGSTMGQGTGAVLGNMGGLLSGGFGDFPGAASIPGASEVPPPDAAGVITGQPTQATGLLSGGGAGGGAGNPEDLAALANRGRGLRGATMQQLLAIMRANQRL